MSNNVQLSELLTPYACAQLANAQLVAVGLPPIPPQMMYNYTSAKLRAGKKPLIAFDPAKGVERVAFEGWLARYLVKKGVTVTVADPEQAEFDESEAH